MAARTMAWQPGISKPPVAWPAAFLVSARTQGGAVLHRLSMSNDVDRGGVSFSEAKPPDSSSCPRRNRYVVRLPLQSTAAAAADALDRAAGMIKKTVCRSSGRRVRGEDDKIPAVKTVAPDLPLDCSGIWTSASIRGLHPLVRRQTPCASPRNRQNEWRACQSE